MDAYSRYFTHLEFRIWPQHKRRKTVGDWTMAQIVGALVKKRQAGVVQFKDEKQFVELRGVTTNSDWARLLIGITDPSASDAAYRNPTRDTDRTFKKETGEGNSYSAHLVIDIKGSGRTYRAILEQAPGLSRGRVRTLINRVCLDTPGLHRELVTSPGERIAPRVEILGEKSNELVDAFSRGVPLSGLEFVKTSDLGVAEDFDEVRYSQAFRLSRDVSGDINIVKALKKIFNAKRDQFDAMKVRFPDPDTGRTRTVTVSTEQQAQDALYYKTTAHEFQSRLEGAPAKIVGRVAEHMESLLVEKRQSGTKAK